MLYYCKQTTHSISFKLRTYDLSPKNSYPLNSYMKRTILQGISTFDFSLLLWLLIFFEKGFKIFAEISWTNITGVCLQNAPSQYFRITPRLSPEPFKELKRIFFINLWINMFIVFQLKLYGQMAEWIGLRLTNLWVAGSNVAAE